MKKIGQEGQPKNYKRKRNGRQKQKTMRNSARPLSQKIEAKCCRKLRLEKVVTNKHLRLAVETEEVRRARLENDAATKWLRLAM